MSVTERAASSGGRRRRVTVTGGDPLCAICLETRHHAVETSCGHLFCAKCLFTHQQQGDPLQGMLCPLCRQQVTLLFLCFTAAELASDEPAAVAVRTAARRGVATYNRRFCGLPRPWLERVRDVPCLLRHLWRELLTPGGLVLLLRVRVVMCFCMALAYVLLPFDLLPEEAYGAMGLLDDAFIVLAMLMYVAMFYRWYLAAQD